MPKYHFISMPMEKKYSLRELLNQKESLVKRIKNNSKELRQIKPKKENIAIVRNILLDQWNAKEDLCKIKHMIAQKNISISYYIYKLSELKTELSDLMILYNSGFPEYLDRIKSIDQEMGKIQDMLEKHNHKTIPWFQITLPEPYITPF